MNTEYPIIQAGDALDVIPHGVRQEVLELRENLRQNETRQHGRVRRLPDGVQPGSDAKLCGVDGGHAYPLGLLHPERHREGLETHFPVALNALEVVHDRDTQSSPRVQQGEDDYL